MLIFTASVLFSQLALADALRRDHRSVGEIHGGPFLGHWTLAATSAQEHLARSGH